VPPSIASLLICIASLNYMPIPFSGRPAVVFSSQYTLSVPDMQYIIFEKNI